MRKIAESHVARILLLGVGVACSCASDHAPGSPDGGVRSEPPQGTTRDASSVVPPGHVGPTDAASTPTQRDALPPEPPSDAGAGESGATVVDEPSSSSSLVPTGLRCELRNDPLAVPTATPRLAWELASTDTRARAQTQSAYELLVASSAAKLAANEGDLFQSGVVASSDSSTTYAGRILGPLTTAHWKVRVRDNAGRTSAWSAAAACTVGLLGAADWGAQWITSAGTAASMPLFRRDVQVTAPLKRALVAVCGLGQFELRVNGVNASDAVMEPSWTNFAKSCHYSTYDVTKALVPGKNTLGVLLGNGMYNVPKTERYAKFTTASVPLKLIARLQLDYADGTSSVTATDASWKAAPGPITFSNIFGGEDFDASKEPAGWDRPTFVDTAWAPAAVVTGTAPALVASSGPPVKVLERLATAKFTQPSPGVFVYDLGQNFAGWPEITVRGSAGATIRLTPGELLDARGLVTQANVGAPVWFSYRLSGAASETWHPRFSYTGFRYVQVEGAAPSTLAASFPALAQITELRGAQLSASGEPVGQFQSSDPDLNRIHALILAALRSNMQSVLTDCPHREKLGWLETAHLLAPSIMFNYDAAAFFEKILGDMRESQTADGFVPNISPEYAVFAADFRDSPEWGSASVIVPWKAYAMYGERKPVEQHYASMKRYAAYLASKATQNALSYGLGDWYDVGPAAPGVSQQTSAGVTASAIWIQDLDILQQTATLLGQAAEAAQFATTRAAVAARYNTNFLKANGSYDRNSQTANAMPIALGIVPEAQRVRAIDSLVASVKSANNQVTAGDVGFAYVIRALEQAGRNDVVFDVLKQSTGPGYLYQLARGATSLTEAWNANPASSQNHAMLGHAEEWLYEGLGGLAPDPAAPGFKKFVIKPSPQAGLASVEVKYHSVRGPILSSWKQSAAGFTLLVDVPVNTSATVYIPGAKPGAVTEGGGPATLAAGVLAHREVVGALVLEVGSGHYTFVAPLN